MTASLPMFPPQAGEHSRVSRRALLSGAAAAGASAATLRAARAVPEAAPVDPIFTAIERHRLAYVRYDEQVVRNIEVEEAIACEVNEVMARFDSSDEVRTKLADLFANEPEMTPDQLRACAHEIAYRHLRAKHGEHESAQQRLSVAEAEADAAEALLRIRPTTIAGVAALARYAGDYIRGGNVFPGPYTIDADDPSATKQGMDAVLAALGLKQIAIEDSVSFETALVASIADALATMEA